MCRDPSISRRREGAGSGIDGSIAVVVAKIEELGGGSQNAEPGSSVVETARRAAISQRRRYGS